MSRGFTNRPKTNLIKFTLFFFRQFLAPGRMDFKELTKKDAQISLAHELDRLKSTATQPENVAARIDKEFDGFKRLFGKFLAADVQASIDWNKIEKLPSDSVSESVCNSAWQSFGMGSITIPLWLRFFSPRLCHIPNWPNRRMARS